MVNEITIENFKSVQNLKLSLSRFNVFIGSNGSGKSNILEAITFAGAASAEKLDNEFFESRGIRPTSARLTKSAFNIDNINEPIKIKIDNGTENSFNIQEKDSLILSWTNLEKDRIETNFKEKVTEYIRSLEKKVEMSGSDAGKFIFQNEDTKSSFINSTLRKMESLVHEQFFFNGDLASFLIYSPEISSLRKFEDESQIKPLGIKGEGIFNVLQIFNESYPTETLGELKNYLHIIEWFHDFEAVADSVTGRKSLVVKDRYMPGVFLNQNNVNEGFLFLLFYISLFISKETPQFFAIDNIEASFHPRLCEELIKRLVELSKKHDKQVILTTHNPFILDGMDLNDPEQTLFVVRRNADGETIADRIDKPLSGVKLSEAWTRGYIGGQPETIY